MNTPTVKILRFRDATLRDYCRDILVAVGVPEPHARIVGDSLVAANLRGVDSHGIGLLAGYVRQLRGKGVDGAAAGEVAFEAGGCLQYDGKNGLGQVVSDRCADHAVRLARKTGLAMVVARNSHHFGAAGYWAEKIARGGCIGIAMTAGGSGIPPWPGKSGRIGTNPLAMAVPGGRWLLDMATTTVAWGKITVAAEHNQATIPACWRFVDAEGKPTTDRLTAERGWPLPLGGYKGSGLGMMVEILCAGLSGGPMATEVQTRVLQSGGMVPLRLSHMFLAIDPGNFIDPGEFQARIGRLVDMMKSSEPADGYDEVLVAGEPEWRMERQRLRDGIPIPQPPWDRLSAIAAKLRISPPQPDAGR